MTKVINMPKGLPTHVYGAVLRSPVNVELLAPVYVTEESALTSAEKMIALGNEKGFNWRKGPHGIYPHYWISIDKKMTLCLMKIELRK